MQARHSSQERKTEYLKRLYKPVSQSYANRVNARYRSVYNETDNMIGCKKESSPVTPEPTIIDTTSTVRFVQDDIAGLYTETIANHLYRWIPSSR